MGKTETRSLPKRKLKEFLENAENNKEYKIRLSRFTVELEEADNFVHRMRVELSRVRAQVRDAGYYPKPFKVKFLEASYAEDDNDFIEITLVKATNDVTDITETLDGIFDKVAGGKKVDV